MLLILIPAAVLLLVFLNWSRAGFSRREACLLTLGSAGLTTVAVTESLSLVGHLSRWPVAVAWLVLGGLLIWVMRKQLPSSVDSKVGTTADASLLWGIGGLIIFLVGVVALNAAPSTWDAMTYHMARVVRWAVNGNLRFFPTNEPQQLFQPPLAEYFMLHLYLLGDSDRLVNLVQVLGFSGAAIGASLVARELGARSFGQSLSAFLVLTLPQGILQASGAKNDCSLALWLVAMLYAALRFLRTDSRFWLIASGTFLALAVLTKGTSYIYAPGFLAAAIGMEWASAKRNWRSLAGSLVLPVLLLNGPHYLRTFQLYGSPIGNGYADGSKVYSFRNESIGLKLLWGNLWRNLALHAATPVPTWNAAIQSSTEDVIRLLGEDPQNPAALWHGSRFSIPELSLRESHASNPWHMLLALATLAWLFWGRNRLDRSLIAYGGGVVLAILLFSLLLRWQPWHTRLHFSWFVAIAPLTAVWMERSKIPGWTGAVIALLLLWAGPALILNGARPLAFGASVLGTAWNTTMFADGPPFQANYEAAVRRLRSTSCKEISVDASRNPYLYPIYALLDPLHSGIRLREIGVTNYTNPLNQDESRGCAAVCLACSQVLAQKDLTLGRDGWLSERVGDVVIFSSPAVGNPNPVQGCGVGFGSGWGERESGGQDWWRWTPKGGVLTISSTTVDKIKLLGVLASVPSNNKARLRWNGKSLPDVSLPGGKNLELQPLELDLDAVVGPNVLEIESAKPGELMPPDTRTFALQIRNLRVKGQKVGACDVL